MRVSTRSRCCGPEKTSRPELLAKVSTMGYPPRVMGLFRRGVAAARRRAALASLWRVADPGNLGTILRAADAFRTTGCTVTRLRRSDRPEGAAGPRRARSSASRWRVSTSRPGSAWRSSRTAGCSGAPRPGRSGHRTSSVPSARGFRRTSSRACDETATIPLAEGSESLNVAVAGAIALYEHRRRVARVEPWLESSVSGPRRPARAVAPDGHERRLAIAGPGPRRLRARAPAEARGALRLEGASGLGRRRPGRDPREPDRRGRRRGAVADRPAGPRGRGRVRDHDGLRSVPPHGRAAPGPARRARGQARDAGASRRGRRGRRRRRSSCSNDSARTGVRPLYKSAVRTGRCGTASPLGSERLWSRSSRFCSGSDPARTQARLATKIMSSPPRCGVRSNQP